MIVHIDGPKTGRDRSRVEKCLEIARNFALEHEATVWFSPTNLGLSASITSGVTRALQDFESIIVLEDDLVVAPDFLSFTNRALSVYRDDPEVVSIHGHWLPQTGGLPDTFFIRGADCWGWATWRSAWALFRNEPRALLDEIEKSGLALEFDLGRPGLYTGMLRDRIAGRNDSWAVCWYASAFLENKLTLYPRVSLVENLGLDGSGTHGGRKRMGWFRPTKRTEFGHDRVRISRQRPVESVEARAALEAYFARTEKPHPLIAGLEAVLMSLGLTLRRK